MYSLRHFGMRTIIVITVGNGVLIFTSYMANNFRPNSIGNI